MPSFNNLQDLYKHITKQVESGMASVGQHVVDKTKQQLDEDVYLAYEPKEYERTHEVRESIEHTPPVANGNEIGTVIYSNSDKIHAHAPNQHHSVVQSYDPQDYSNYVVETIVDGTSGDIFGSGAWTTPRPFFDNAREKINTDNSHIEVMKKALKSKGLNAL